MDNRVYTFDPEFRKQILALMLQPVFVAKYGEVIKPEYFTETREKVFCEMIKQHRIKYQNSLPEEADMFIDMPDERVFVHEIYDLSKRKLHRTEDEVISWAKDEAMRVAILQSATDYEQGKFSEITERVSKALKVGQDLQDTGIDFVQDASKWIYGLDEGVTIPTPWVALNNRIEGGLRKGELFVVMAPPNGYKSTVLANLAFGATSMGEAHNVLFFTLEMSEIKVARRIAARILGGRMYNMNEDNPQEFVKMLETAAMQRMMGNIRIKQYPAMTASILDFKDFYTRQAESGFVADLIIIDYADLMIPVGKQYDVAEKRHALSKIWVDCRNLGIDLDVGVWTATQTNRGGVWEKNVDMGDVAEDFSKNNTADAIFPINQTKDEYNKKLFRLGAAKVRDGDKGFQIQMSIEQYPVIVSLGEYDGLDTEDDED
jgi:replicative DNA helicase